MCGICGVVAVGGHLPPGIAQAMPQMTRTIQHRGPDGQGVMTFEGASLGHRRLAIIDRAGGSQPMSNEDDSLWVVFNGEIYNHHDLRKRLEDRGHRFKTISDTETILHAYEEFGTGCVAYLEGMFAFVVYDRRRREAFMARDRLGKKPLFWGLFDGVLHFASEIKAIAASPLFDDTLDLSGLEGYLSLGYFLAPRTVYRHVNKLEPGHWLRVADGQISIRKYWDIAAFDNDGRRPDALVADLDRLLRVAVHERLESEVPLGAFLSGGIDSALVVALMAEDAGRTVTTTSVGFGARSHNELAAAGVTARHLATNHYPEIVEPDLDDILPRLVRAFDEPFADASAIPTYYVSQMARRHVTVALSGDGGDEAFGGYDFRYVPHAVESRLARFVPGAPGRAVAATLASVWPRSPRLPRPLRLAGVWRNLSVDRAEAYFNDLCFVKPDAARRLMGRASGRRDDSWVFDAVTSAYRSCSSRDPIQCAEYADLKIYLPNDVLTKVDRMSMAHGLEVRCPLLDRRVIEFAFSVPASVKMPGLRSKALLRGVARGKVPRQVLDLPKHGFTAPVGEWIAGAYAGRFRDETLSGCARIAGLLDQRELSRVFDDHRSGRAWAPQALWAAWILECWARQVKAPASPAAMVSPPA